MSAFTIDSLSTYGGPFANYGTGVTDPTTDMDASMGNKMLAATAGMTHTAPRAWVSMTLNGSATPVLVNWDALWKVATPTAPVLAISSTGVFTVTLPANVADEIVIGAAGYTGPQPYSLRAGWVNFQATTGALSAFVANVRITSANVATVNVFTGGALANPSASVNVDVFLI